MHIHCFCGVVPACGVDGGCADSSRSVSDLCVCVCVCVYVGFRQGREGGLSVKDPVATFVVVVS